MIFFFWQIDTGLAFASGGKKHKIANKKNPNDIICCYFFIIYYIYLFFVYK